MLGETKAGICVKMHISFIYKGLECADLQKEQNKDVKLQKEDRTVREYSYIHIFIQLQSMRYYK